MSNSAVETMFQHKGKTVTIIGKTRIKTYRDLYLQLSDLQKNKEIPVHSDYLGDNDLAINIYKKKYYLLNHCHQDSYYELEFLCFSANLIIANKDLDMF